MSLGTITFNGVDLGTTYNCYYDGSEIWRKPQKMVDFYSVPGRNGDLSVSQQKWSNLTIPFNCYIKDDFTTNFNDLYNFLASTDGYAKLTCTEDPGHYRMAQFVDEVQPNMGQKNERGDFVLSFNCQPQRYLTNQQIALPWTYDYTTESYNGTVVTNDTPYASSPVYYIKYLGEFSAYTLEIWTPHGDISETSYTAIRFINLPNNIKSDHGIMVDTANETITDQQTGADLTPYVDTVYHEVNWEVMRYKPYESKEIVLGESEMGINSTYIMTGFFEL